MRKYGTQKCVSKTSDVQPRQGTASDLKFSADGESFVTLRAVYVPVGIKILDGDFQFSFEDVPEEELAGHIVLLPGQAGGLGDRKVSGETIFAANYYDIGSVKRGSAVSRPKDWAHGCWFFSHQVRFTSQVAAVTAFTGWVGKDSRVRKSSDDVDKLRVSFSTSHLNDELKAAVTEFVQEAVDRCWGNPGTANVSYDVGFNRQMMDQWGIAADIPVEHPSTQVRTQDGATRVEDSRGIYQTVAPRLDSEAAWSKANSRFRR